MNDINKSTDINSVISKNINYSIINNISFPFFLLFLFLFVPFLPSFLPFLLFLFLLLISTKKNRGEEEDLKKKWFLVVTYVDS